MLPVTDSSIIQTIIDDKMRQAEKYRRAAEIRTTRRVHRGRRFRGLRLRSPRPIRPAV